MHYPEKSGSSQLQPHSNNGSGALAGKGEKIETPSLRKTTWALSQRRQPAFG